MIRPYHEKGGGTLADLLSTGRESQEAIAVPGGPSTTYGQLGAQVESLASALQGVGVRPGQVVCLVLGNGLPFVAGFLAVAVAGATAATVAGVAAGSASSPAPPPSKAIQLANETARESANREGSHIHSGRRKMAAPIPYRGHNSPAAARRGEPLRSQPVSPRSSSSSGPSSEPTCRQPSPMRSPGGGASAAVVAPV